MIYQFIQRIKDLWRGNLLGGARSPKWSSIRKQFLEESSTCAICGKKGTLLKPNECHHCVPFSVDKTKELDFQNLIVACRRCHLLFCHLNSWRSFDSDIKKSAADMLYKIQNRP